jgi:hypothetical protein
MNIRKADSRGIPFVQKDKRINQFNMSPAALRKEHILIPDALFLIVPAAFRHKYGWRRGRQFMVWVRFVNESSTMLTAIQMKNQVFTDTVPCKLMVRDVSEKPFAFTFT